MISKRLRLITGLVPVFLCACSSMPGIYVEVGAGYKLESTTSYVLRPDCNRVRPTDTNARAFASCGGDNPTAHFSVGYEFERPYRCEYRHFSHFFDGGSDRETHMDEVICLRKWGGR